MIRKYIVAGIIVVLAIFLIGLLGKAETHYSRTGIVKSSENGIVLIEDTRGNLWEIESEDFEENETVEFVLFTNGTHDITDDVVESIK